MKIPYPLLESIRKGQVSLFFGAGASKGAGYPLAYELAQHLISEAGLTDDLQNLSLDQIVQYLYGLDGYGKEWVRGKTIELFSGVRSQLQSPPSLAHQLMTEFRWRKLFTTNCKSSKCFGHKRYVGKGDLV